VRDYIAKNMKGQVKNVHLCYIQHHSGQCDWRSGMSVYITCFVYKVLRTA